MPPLEVDRIYFQLLHIFAFKKIWWGMEYKLFQLD